MILGRLQMATGLVWAIGFVVAAILFLLAAPGWFQITATGVVAMLVLLVLVTAGSFLHIRQLGRILASQPLGQDLYRHLTRFPQASSLLFFYMATCMGVASYLWMKLYLKESLWVSFITMAMFLSLATLGSICQYFLAKQNLMKVFKTLASQPGFNDSQARFTTSLRTKFGFGILGITGGVLVVSILVSGLILQSSTRTTVTNYARNELSSIADSVAFVSEMNTTPEDMDAFLGTLKLGAGGGVSLRLPQAKGGALLGSKVQPKGGGDILVVQPLADGSELRAVIPEAEYASSIWKALRPNIAILALSAIFLAYFIPLILRDIQQPLQVLSRNTQQVGEGHIDRLEPVYSDDEVASLVQGFGNMVGSLRGMVV